jgi:hypothetical protein
MVSLSHQIVAHITAQMDKRASGPIVEINGYLPFPVLAAELSKNDSRKFSLKEWERGADIGRRNGKVKCQYIAKYQNTIYRSNYRNNRKARVQGDHG